MQVQHAYYSWIFGGSADDLGKSIITSSASALATTRKGGAEVILCPSHTVGETHALAASHGGLVEKA